MTVDSDQWLCVDDLFDADHPRQAFSGAQNRAARSVDDSTGDAFGPDADLRHCWRDLVSAAHHDLERCAARLGVLTQSGARMNAQVDAQADAQAVARELERGCDRLASRDRQAHAQADTQANAQALLPRACVLSGLIGRLIRDAYDYVNVRVVMGEALINYQLVCAKLADMVIADEIVEQRLIAALGAPRRARDEAGWRGVPAPDAAANLKEIVRCAATVLRLYVEIYAGNAFVQRAAEAPVLGVAQALLDGMLASPSWGT